MDEKSGSNRARSHRRPLSRRQRRVIFTAAIAVLSGLFLAGRLDLLPEAAPTDTARYHNKTFTVINVVDGDTLDLDVPDGRERYTRVRLWGVDTPETKHPQLGVMYFGPEAAEFTRELVLNKEVRAVLEPFENTRDKYDRLLAYVYVSEKQHGQSPSYEEEDAGKMPAVRSEEAGGTPAVRGVRMLNEELVRRGYGYADDRFRHMFRDRFVKLQKEAQAEGRGLWKEARPEQWPEWYRKRQESDK